ncbi:hypothetical protein D3C84_867000 [compost metagenome]
MDEGDIGDADKTQRLTQIGLLLIERAAGIDTATSGQDKGTLALEQALGSFCGVLEGDPGAQHMIQPGFQRAGNGEVVHRRAQHQHIRRQQLVSKLIRAPQRCLLGGTLLRSRLHPATEQLDIQVRHRLARQIADRHCVLRMRLLPVLDELGHQLTGYRTLLTDTAFNHQNIGHLHLPPPGRAIE